MEKIVLNKDIFRDICTNKGLFNTNSVFKILNVNKEQAIAANVQDYIEIFRSNQDTLTNMYKMYNSQIEQNKSTEKLSQQQILQFPVWMAHLSAKCN